MMKTQVKLTRRQSEVAELIAWGASKKEIADMLFISEITVANTARNIYEKIEIKKATELCVWWFSTRYQIPLSHSPLFRRICAAVLLTIFISGALFENSEFVRRSRVEISECARSRRAREEESSIHTLKFHAA